MQYSSNKAVNYLSPVSKPDLKKSFEDSSWLLQQILWLIYVWKNLTCFNNYLNHTKNKLFPYLSWGLIFKCLALLDLSGNGQCLEGPYSMGISN